GDQVTRQAVHLFETGGCRPTWPTLRVLARRLKVPPEWLLGDAVRNTVADHPDRRMKDLDGLCRLQEFDRAIRMARSILSEGDGDYMAAHAHYAIGQSLCLLGNPDQAGEALEHLALAAD